MHNRRILRTLSIFALSIMILSSFFTFSPHFQTAHAVSTRTLVVDPHSQPQQPKGTQLSYAIRWQTSNSSDTINAWDITVNVTSTTPYLSPSGVSITGNIFGTTTGPVHELVNCINQGYNPDGQRIPVDSPGNLGCNILDGPGIAHSVVFSTTPAPSGASGLLFTIGYTVIVNGGFTPIRFVNHVVAFYHGINAPHDAIDGEYGTRPGNDPIASFSYSPTNPIAGNPINFNASLSHDDPANTPNGITLYTWNFGDGSGPVATAKNSTAHAFVSIGSGYGLTGNFTVTLTVTDRLGLTGVTTVIVSIVNLPFHDNAVQQILVSQEDHILPGTPIQISVVVVDHGTYTEKGFNLTVSIENEVLKTYNYTDGLITSQKITTNPVVWNTTGKPYGAYQIQAELMPIRAANGTILESNNCPTKVCLSNNIGYHIVRLNSPQGVSIVSLSLVQSIGLAFVVLVAVGTAWSIVGGRIDRRRRQAAEALP